MSQRDEDDEERHSCPSGVTGDQGRFLTKVGLYFNHVSALYRTVSQCIMMYMSDSDVVDMIQVSRRTRL